MARSIKSLVSLGLLTRTDDAANQRVKKVYVTEVTEAAKEFKVYWTKVVNQWNQTILADLTPEERTIIAALRPSKFD